MNDFEIKFYEDSITIDDIQNEYLLLFIIHGSATVTLTAETNHLSEKDILMINWNRHFKLQTSPETFMLIISIRAELFRELTHKRLPYFQCCSSRHSSVKYEQLRYLIYDLLGEYALDMKEMSAKKLSILYKICDHLICSFLLSDKQPLLETSDERLDHIFSYIEEHFSEHITLPDAARQIHIAPTSLSRLFKKNTGITFVQYITNIRLRHAVSDLTGSQLSISDIALNNGFSTASQFNKIFRQAFNLSPGEYRKRHAMLNTTMEMQISKESADMLNEYRSKTRMVVVKEQKIKIQSVNVDCSKGKNFKNPWGSMIYLGFASRILSGTYQRQIQFLKHTLDFQYGCINGLFSPEFALFDSKQTTQLNFVNLDHILDFLVENGIRPMIVFDNQVLNILKKLNDIYEMSTANFFSDSQEFIYILETILDHMINRYGLKEVSSWKFVIWYFVYRQTLLGIPGEFNNLWDDFFETIRSKIPNASIGGVGYSPSVHKDTITEFYRNWSHAKHMPDFITINSYPYREAEESTKMNALRQNINHFFSNDLSEIHSILEESGFPKRPIVVIEWNLSFVHRNFLNDMAAKAAIMIHQMVDTLGEVEDICYWYASDIFAGGMDAKRILNGACGLLSSDGFCKPPYYALLFFKQLHNYLIERNDHYIVTKDELGHFSILLFNNKALNYEYYSKDEAAIGMDDEPNIFNDHDALEITLRLQGVSNKNYRIRKQLFGPNFGSILDEWKRLGTDLELTLDEISYLKRKSIPHRKNETLCAENNTLILQEVLQEHEIMLIQID